MNPHNTGLVARCLDATLHALGLMPAEPQAPVAQVVRWAQGSRPVLAFESLDGLPVLAASLAGRVVVANFWAVWSDACRAQLPVLANLARTTQGLPVEVLLVNTGDSVPQIEKVRNTLPASLGMLRLASDAQDFRFSSLPATVVFDRQLRPRWVVRGACDAQAEPLRGLIEGLLAEDGMPPEALHRAGV